MTIPRTINRPPRLVFRNQAGKRLNDGQGVPSSIDIQQRTLLLSQADSAFLLKTRRDSYQASYVAVKRRDGTTVSLPDVTVDMGAPHAAAAVTPSIEWNPNVVADAAINTSDLLWVIAHWGHDDGTGTHTLVGIQHMLKVLAAWGPVVVAPSPQSPSPSISLGNGVNTIKDKAITGTTGIVGGNATHVTLLDVSNTSIRCTNYGIYCGDCDEARLAHVDITCDANGPDSYSIRGNITHLTSSDSSYRSGIKAFRIYGLESGSSTRDHISGDRLMLGGGYADEWGPAGPFHSFTFKDGFIDVNSVEMYSDTHDVLFENVDFLGTDHISIQWGAHHITFKGCKNLPQIKRYNAARQLIGTGPDPARSIVVI